MSYTRKDISIIKGDTYEHVFEFDADQSDYTYSAVLTDGTTDINFAVVVESATEIVITLTTVQTSALNADGTTQYKYRVVRTSDSETTTVAAGRAVIIDL